MGLFGKTWWSSGGQEDTFAWAPAAPAFQGGDAFQFTANRDVVLTTGSDLNRTADGPWPEIISEDVSYQIGVMTPPGTVPNELEQPTYWEVKSGNYGLEGGVPDWYFRDSWARVQYDMDGTGGTAIAPRMVRQKDAETDSIQALYPIEGARSPYRPTFNNLPPVTNYQTRVVDYGQWDNQYSLGSPPGSENQAALDFTAAGAASAQETLL